VYVKDNLGPSYTERYRWLTGTGTGANYEIRCDLVGGIPFSSGTMATWHALSADRTWTRVDSVWGDPIASGTFQIRDASTLSVLASGLISLECDYGTGTPP
jgi:hypothetical protein